MLKDERSAINSLFVYSLFCSFFHTVHTLLTAHEFLLSLTALVPYETLNVISLIMHCDDEVLFCLFPVTSAFVSNLTPLCMKCLCHAASSCNLTVGCLDTYCGPFQFNREYWKDAGRHVLLDDNPGREGGESPYV